MPTYEYECQKCGHHFDVFQSIKDGPKRSCPKCKGRVKRVLGMGAGLLFKGSGFYITDHRQPSYKEAAKKESSASSSAGSNTGSSAGGSSASGSKPAVPKKTTSKE